MRAWSECGLPHAVARPRPISLQSAAGPVCDETPSLSGARVVVVLAPATRPSHPQPVDHLAGLPSVNQRPATRRQLTGTNKNSSRLRPGPILAAADAETPDEPVNEIVRNYSTTACAIAVEFNVTSWK